MSRMKVHTGHWIGYQEYGKGPPLLLIPATGVDHTMYGDHLNAFADRFRVVALDNLGTGESDRPENIDAYTAAGFADDAVGLLEALDIPQAHVAGLSMGSIIAQEVALRYPHKVRSLSLYNTWGATDPFLHQVFSIWQSLLQHEGFPFAGTAMLYWLLSETAWIQHPELPRQLSQLVFEAPQAPAIPITIAHIEVDKRHQLLPRLSEIRIPTLVLAGEQDRLTSPRYALAVHEAIPGSRLEVITGPGSGHLAFNERAEDFRRIALDFLNTV
ncbi:MAG: alpha/beta fold hydrolase [Acidithiobacillus sp.]|nr:alpha/beta fold hydrolase [Acidithiobacillus sp.]